MATYEIITCVFTLILTMVTDFTNAVSIEATAPVNPVDHGGILSLHCHVRDMESDHSVIIIRSLESGEVEHLSWRETLTSNADDRIFLAFRRLGDGSVVYFLSIMNVKKEDAGIYSCRVMSLSALVDEQSLTYNVNYFPVDIYPVCGPSEQIYAKAGDVVLLNCTSDKAFPEVTLEWTHSSTKQVSSSTNVIYHDSKVSSILRLETTKNDNGAVYVCTMRSEVFSDKVRTCHIGPLYVTPNSDLDIDLEDKQVDSLPTESELRTKPGQRDTLPGLDESQSPDIQIKCNEICSTLPTSSTHFFWIVAAVTTFIVTFIFFVLLMILAVQYKRNKERMNSALKDGSSDLYEKVDYRGFNRKIYMTLATRGLPEHGISCGEP